MKTIYVTVAEFLENGGEIKPPKMRQLYGKNGIRFDILDSDLYTSIIKNDANDYYVAIECEPKYI